MKAWRYILLAAALFVAGGIGVWVLSGDDEEPATTVPLFGAPPEGTEPSGTPLPNKQVEEDTATREAAAMNQAWRLARSYVEAIDARDGEFLCKRVEGLADLDLPVRRSSCAESVSESIGYRDPRGIPVFESAVVTGAPEVEVDGGSARATVTVVTEFADRDEPSVEDDVVYLVRRAGVWVIAKPSSTLYRAIGTPDVPPDVLEPPE